jgi:TPR repeat protein
LAEAEAALTAGDYGRARTLLQALAEKGDPQGQYLLGHLLDLGLGVEPDPAKALSWWLKAAEVHHPMALYRAGLAYLQGRGVDPDSEKGLQLLEQAALYGVHPAETAIGKALAANLRGPGHMSEALVWLSCAAEAGDREAAELAGLAYAKGTDETLADGPKAVRFLRLAEKLGSSLAPKVLHDINPAKDVVVATEDNVHLLFEAARMGYPDAQFRLAVLGLANVPWGPSRGEAVKLLEIAALNGHPEAAYRWLQWRRKQGPLPSALEAETLLRQAAEGGFTPAAAELGKLLLARQSPEALRWLRTAIQAGHLWACLDLAEFFFTGVGGSPNPSAALETLATLLSAQDPNLKKQAAQLALRYGQDSQSCQLAQKLDPSTPCPPPQPSTKPTSAKAP